MTQESTAGHGPSKGFHSMNDHLKRYFRGKDNPHQKRMDQAFTRVGPLGKLPHGTALRSGKIVNITKRNERLATYSAVAIKKVREEAAAGATVNELHKRYGISRSYIYELLGGTARKGVK